MTKGWSVERKAAQRLAIQRWKSWERSTGPRTKAGKARVARNAFGGETRKTIMVVSRLLKAALKSNREVLKSLNLPID